ncbi:hypothetical protein BZL41_19205 [Pseudomonas sp. PIC25]|nr:hypothetical protein BZL41_19205 [Pseudomonas sp. PIC25]
MCREAGQLLRPPIPVSAERMRQIREQLGLGSAFQLFEASQVLDLYTGFGVVQVALPPGEFLVALQDQVGVRRYGVVRFEGLPDSEGWAQN